MIWLNVRMAMATIRGAKIRSFLTMLGVIIAVFAVVLIISLGQGLKSGVKQEINKFGQDLVQINPGNAFERDESGKITNFNFTALFSGATLSEKDLTDVRNTEGVRIATPQMFLDARVFSGDTQAKGASIIATDSNFLEVANQEIGDGEFLSAQITNPFVVVIGSNLAKELYGETRPLGQKLKIRNQEFTVIGVMKEYKSLLTSFSFGGGDLNKFVYIPLEAGKRLNQGTTQIIEIDVKVDDIEHVDQIIGRISDKLKTNRGGDTNFAISKPSEFFAITDQIFNQITLAVTAIALVSVLVGGIGIANIMFAVVTERTREIGIRKSIGATNGQILMQFLVEAITISLIGALIGIGLAFIVGTIIANTTEISPQWTLPFLGLVVLASVGVGVLSGIAPAIKAARKDPVEALRYE